jgi:eukaryotic-like serine/threonine-protein kinase
LSELDRDFEAEYEIAIDALINQLDGNPLTDPDELLRKFPERRSEILRLIGAARLEIEHQSRTALPPPPLPFLSPDSRTAILKDGRIDTDAALPAQASDDVVLPLQLGLYTLVARIGKGGMGEVYQAVQNEPIRREVAIKIVRPQSVGRDILARFENERQTLARMNHPNIAVVLDGGSTDDGRPFFVMELVRGLGITEYCRTHDADIPQRLRLLLQVCAGVQHAHQKGIIHRDIKPSNVLVTEVDGQPVPKVIDFGLAKIQMNSQANVGEFHSSHTQLGQILGTLLYMSPEQASLKSDEVDTRSDVFALGILLFELLTGTAPLENQLGSDLPIDERLRRVRQQGPMRPSDRVRTPARSESPFATIHSGKGGISVSHQLRGDLDAICMKAMAADPASRYDTVTSLAEDLRRYLENRPVLATSPSELSALLRYAYRHRVAMTITGAFVGLLFVATVVSALLALRATRAEQLLTSRNVELTIANERAETNLYIAQMNLVQQAFQERDIEQARDYLDRHIPLADARDPRGFEWYYWDHRLRRYLGESRASQEVTSMAYAPNGEFIVSSGMDGIVEFWDPQSHELLRVLAGGSKDMVAGLAISPDSTRLAASGRDGCLALWDLTNKDALISSEVFEQGLRCLVFDQTNRLFAGSIDGGILVWPDAVSNSIKLGEHEKDVYALAISPASRWLASGGGEGQIKIWDIKSLECVATFAGHQAAVRSLAFSPDGQLLASGSYDSTVCIWELDAGQVLHRLDGHTEQVYGVAFAPNGKTLASCSRDELIKLWDVASGDELETIIGNRFTIYGVAYAPNGKQLFSGAFDKTLRYWDMTATREISVLQNHEKSIQSIAFSPDGQWIASASEDESVAICSLAGDAIHRLQPQHGACRAIAFLPPIEGQKHENEQRLLVGFEDGTLEGYHLPSGERVLETPGRDDNWISRIEVSPDGKRFATVAGRSARLWNADTFALEHEFPAPSDFLYTLAFSPDGSRLAMASDEGVVSLWDLNNYEEVYRIVGPAQRVYTMRFTQDGQQFAYAGRDRLIHLCETATGTELLEFRGHSSSVHGIVFTDNDRTLISGGTDMQLKIWDVATGEVKTTLHEHTLPITDLQLSADGQTLVTADGNDSIRFWYR